MKTITLPCVILRHGKTQGNIEKRYIGCRTDEPLSEQGICELAEIKTDLSASGLVCVSPMLRARQTANILFPGCRKFVIEELTESDFGRFEGKNYQELNGDPEYQRWIDSGGTAPFPGGEAPQDFRNRSYRGFEKAVQEALRQDADRLWIVAHGGTVMSVMSRLTGKEYFDFMTSCGQGFAFTCEVQTEEAEDADLWILACRCTAYQPFDGKS